MKMFPRRGKVLKLIAFAACISCLVGQLLVFYMEKGQAKGLYSKGHQKSDLLKSSILTKPNDAQTINEITNSRTHVKETTDVEKNASNAELGLESAMKDNTKNFVSYNAHIFYYPWYGNPEIDGEYQHWDHPYMPHWNKMEAAKWPSGRHVPPDDIGSSFYPQLGVYSSRDPKIVELHMQQIQRSGAGVVSVSWYPKGDSDNEGREPDNVIPLLLNMAHKFKLKVNFHIEPFKNRNHITLKTQIKYILDNYGSHPAFYRYYDANKKRSLPLFYIYDSYQVAPNKWAQLFKPDGSISIRNTELDGIFIGLLVTLQHRDDIYQAGFDGFYTYFATDGFTYGSSWKSWRNLKKFARLKNLLFIPSVGPGYIDTSVRPWNGNNIRKRGNGKYYSSAFQTVWDVKPPLVSITSFNEWHEGTQIEPAIPKKFRSRQYLDYGNHGPNFYLDLTRHYIEKLYYK